MYMELDIHNWYNIIYDHNTKDYLSVLSCECSPVSVH